MRRDLQIGIGRATDLARRRAGFTLLEVLIALTITLILMTLVVRVFQYTSDGVFNSRANMEMSDQIRNAKHRLIQDLRGTTALTIPPAEITWGVGYFEYFEGQSVAITGGGDIGFRPTNTLGTLNSLPVVLTEFGDRDDILMFTTANFDEAFLGRLVIGGQPRGVRSKFAEVAWYPHVVEDAANANRWMMTLRRRQWLVTSQAPNSSHKYDSSWRNSKGAGAPTQWLGGAGGATTYNTLESLTKREFRMMHEVSPALVSLTSEFGAGAPQRVPSTQNRLPAAVRGITVGAYPNAPFDFTSLSLQTITEQDSGGTDRREDNNSNAASRTTREAEDIILTNVISFDVKAWDPGAPVFRVVADPDDPEKVGCVQPGDAGYLPAVNRFISSPGGVQNQPLSFGAYADLNYMGFLASQGSYTLSITGTSFPLTRYQNALGAMATSVTGNFPKPYFAGPGDITAQLGAFRDASAANIWSPAVYDTHSRHYEFDGLPSITTTTGGVNVAPVHKRINWYTGGVVVDSLMNGIDDNGNGLVDEPMEREASPPYEKPLRGIRVLIRTMEPDSKKVRQVTVVHEFMPL